MTVNINQARKALEEFRLKSERRPDLSEEGAQALWDYAEADIDDLLELAGLLTDDLEEARRSRPALDIHYDTENDGGSGEWAALYVNGELDCVGDNYNIEERAFKLAGVTTIQDSSFLRGQNTREGCAQTLEEVETYRDERRVRLDKAAELRAQAAALETEAKSLEATS